MMAHIGFLTEIEKASLPYPQVSPRILLGIENACSESWQKVISNPLYLAKLNTCNEVEATIFLIQELCLLLQNNTCPTFTKTLFSTPVRGQEVVNYDGKKLEKRPDITFSFLDTSRSVSMEQYDAIFAECKILDGASKSINLYASQGINRFLNGDYAWAMPNALMIAYVKSTKVTPNALNVFLSDPLKKINYNVQKNSYPCLNSSCQVLITEHSRNWIYPSSRSSNPGNISIRHLWLKI